MENYNKKTEDLGWEKMQALLNSEMPVIQPSSKKRPVLLWWWIIGVAVSLAGTGYWLYQVNTTDTGIKKPVFSDSSIAAQTNKHETISAREPAFQFVEKDNSHLQESKVETGTNQVELPEQVTDFDIASTAFGRNTAVQQQLQAPVPTLNPQEKALETAEIASYELRQEVTTAGLMTGLPLNKIASVDLDLFKLDLPAVHTIKKLPFDFYLNAGVSAKSLNNPLTYRVGAGIDYRINDKWGWMAGIQYAHSRINRGSNNSNYQQFFKSESVFNLGDPIPDTTLIASGIEYIEVSDNYQIITTSNNVLPDALLDPGIYDGELFICVATPSGEIIAYIQDGQIILNENISSVSILELPLNGYYKLNPRFQLEAGLTLSYINRIGLGNSDLASLNTPGSFDNNKHVGTRPGNIGIRRFDLGLSVGAAWQINPHLSAYGAYRQGVIDYTVLKGQHPDLFRNVDIGLRYRF
jgi:hypothetical protein